MAFRPDPKPEPKQKKKPKPLKRSPINKNRIAKTGSLSAFFEKMISICPPNCENCNGRIFQPSHDNIAHILQKSKHLEVASNPDGILFLGGRFDACNCHSQFDSSFEKRESMKVFPLALERFKKLQPILTTWSKERDFYESKING